MTSPLPLASRPLVFGQPRHGLVTAGEIALPNGTQYTVPKLNLGIDGDSYKLAGPSKGADLRLPADIAADDADGLEFPPYALMGGDNFWLNGQSLSKGFGIGWIWSTGERFNWWVLLLGGVEIRPYGFYVDPVPDVIKQPYSSVLPELTRAEFMDVLEDGSKAMINAGGNLYELTLSNPDSPVLTSNVIRSTAVETIADSDGQTYTDYDILGFNISGSNASIDLLSRDPAVSAPPACPPIINQWGFVPRTQEILQIERRFKKRVYLGAYYIGTTPHHITVLMQIDFTDFHTIATSVSNGYETTENYQFDVNTNQCLTSGTQESGQSTALATDVFTAEARGLLALEVDGVIVESHEIVENKNSTETRNFLNTNLPFPFGFTGPQFTIDKTIEGDQTRTVDGAPVNYGASGFSVGSSTYEFDGTRFLINGTELFGVHRYGRRHFGLRIVADLEQVLNTGVVLDQFSYGPMTSPAGMVGPTVIGAAADKYGTWHPVKGTVEKNKDKRVVYL